MTIEQYAQEIQNELQSGKAQTTQDEYLILVEWLTRIASENFNAGLERAANIISPQNPEARSANAEIRCQCSREIRREKHQ